jgi:hypothetical protein
MGMSDRLEEMFEMQRDLQLQMKPIGRDPATLEGQERVQFFKDMKLAYEAELQEMLDEMSWKPWATGEFFNEAAVHGELVDQWHFFINLCIAARLSHTRLHELYMAMRIKNIKRQEEGYDGVSTKCPQCKRALDDDAVLCYLPGNDPQFLKKTHHNQIPLGWCDQKKRYYSELSE